METNPFARVQRRLPVIGPWSNLQNAEEVTSDGTLVAWRKRGCEFKSHQDIS